MFLKCHFESHIYAGGSGKSSELLRIRCISSSQLGETHLNFYREENWPARHRGPLGEAHGWVQNDTCSTPHPTPSKANPASIFVIKSQKLGPLQNTQAEKVICANLWKTGKRVSVRILPSRSAQRQLLRVTWAAAHRGEQPPIRTAWCEQRNCWHLMVQLLLIQL